MVFCVDLRNQQPSRMVGPLCYVALDYAMEAWELQQAAKTIISADFYRDKAFHVVTIEFHQEPREFVWRI